MDNSKKFCSANIRTKPKEPISLEAIPEKVVNSLYQEFSSCEELYDKLNIAYAIAEFYK